MNFSTGYTIITGFVFCGYMGFVLLGEGAGQCCTLPPAKSAAGSALIPTENPLSYTYVNPPTNSSGKKIQHLFMYLVAVTNS